jgi:hypothetical protein
MFLMPVGRRPLCVEVYISAVNASGLSKFLLFNELLPLLVFLSQIWQSATYIWKSSPASKEAKKCNDEKDSKGKKMKSQWGVSHGAR